MAGMFVERSYIVELNDSGCDVFRFTERGFDEGVPDKHVIWEIQIVE